MDSVGSKNFSYGRRLHYRWEYRRFFNSSEVIRLSEVTIFRIKNDLPHFRLGITLKCRGSSPERNSVKRQIRESFRNLGDSLAGFDYNVVVSGSKKMAHPFPRKLGACLRNELSHAIVRN